MIDWLKPILGDGYNEEIDNKIAAEINKGFVAKADYDAANDAQRTAAEALANANKALAEYKDTDIDGLRKRTENGDLKRELIGVYFNYKLTVAPGIDRAEYSRFWDKITEPEEFHTVTVPGTDGDYTFMAYFSNIGDELLLQRGKANYWKGLTINFIAKTPARF